MTYKTVDYDKALCTKSDLDFFNTSPVARNEAIALCMLCTERRTCLSGALNTPEVYGVWGGNDEWELRRDVQLNGEKEPHEYNRPPRCAWCKSLDIEYQNQKIRDNQRNKKLFKCKECELTWWIFTVPKSKAVK